MSNKNYIDLRMRRLDDLSISREEFLDIWQFAMETTIEAEQGVDDLLAKLWRHPSLPTDLLVSQMKTGLIGAWQNPGAELAMLVDPDIAAFDRGLRRAASVALWNMRKPGADPEEDRQCLSYLRGTGRISPEWRARLIAAIRRRAVSAGCPGGDGRKGS